MEEKVRAYLLSKLYTNAGLGDNYIEEIKLHPPVVDREAFKRLKELENDIVNFVKGGKNLYIYSTTCGNGKTSWAVKLLQAYFKGVCEFSAGKCKGLFINVPKLCQDLKDNITSPSAWVAHLKKNLQTCDLVVWDDIGAKDLSAFEESFILPAITARLNNKKSNIYTSNLSGSSLAETMDARLYSRVFEKSEKIEFKGADQRGTDFSKGAK